MKALRRLLRAPWAVSGQQGLFEACVPEVVQAIAPMTSRGGRLGLEIVVRDGWPLRMVPRSLAIGGGSLDLRPVRAAPMRAQLARVEPQWLAGASRPIRTLGTIGLLAADRSRPSSLFAATAGHVLGAHVLAAFDDPALIEVASSGLRIERARLAQWSTPPGMADAPCRVDAGIVRLTGDEIRRLLAVRPALLHADVADPPAPGDPITLLRADGSRIAGTMGEPRSQVRVEMERIEADGSVSSAPLRIESLLFCRWTTAPEDGDSGAAILDAKDRLVGLHCSFGASADPSDLNASFSPIREIEAFFELTVLKAGWSLAPPSTTSAKALASAAARPPLVAPPAAAPAPASSVDTLARTLWAEARGEKTAGMEAVARVVMNRVAKPRWWGHDVVSVCRKPSQFSCWNPGTRSLALLLAVTAADDAFRDALAIAGSAVGGALADMTNGALHYHSIDVLPRWARGHAPCFRLGRHIFYNDIL